MPILRSDDAPEYDMNGIRVRGLAAPSRGALETTTYRVELAPGQTFPEHTHDHEEVFHVLSGRMTISIAGEETALEAGDTVMIPPDVLHFPSAPDDAATLLAVMPAGTRLIRADGERLEPAWYV